MGIETDFDRQGDTGRKRLIRITRKTIVQTVQSSANDRPADRPSSTPSSIQPPENPVENGTSDDMDDESGGNSDEYRPGMDGFESAELMFGVFCNFPQYMIAI
jgi:hypothetical protein